MYASPERWLVQRVRCFAIELQRIEAVARSPLYASFSEVLAGLVTVRAFGEQGRFQPDEGGDEIFVPASEWCSLDCLR